MIQRIHNYDLSTRNTFRMRVRCALYVEVTEEADLPALDWDSLPQPVLVMGGGSNLLFTRDFPGTVLHCGMRFTRPSGPRNDKDAQLVVSSVIPSEANGVPPGILPFTMSPSLPGWSSTNSAPGQRRRASGGRKTFRSFPGR